MSGAKVELIVFWQKPKIEAQTFFGVIVQICISLNLEVTFTNLNLKTQNLNTKT